MGKTVAHYEVFENLGAGGMGQVYGARDTRLGRTVAIKVLPDEVAKDTVHLHRLKREARALAAINHPNIAAIYGIEDDDPSSCFLVLERVDGETLAARLKRGPLPLADALRVGHSIAGALKAAHEKGIVHRDLKPANVMVSSSGVVKVLDFGIARLVPGGSSGDRASDETQTALTQPGRVIGTPAYMSPEQIRGAEQDERTDIFAFGCVLYESLTGTRAFRGATAAEVMASVLFREPNWRALPGTTPPPVRDLLGRCLEKDSSSRYRDMGDVRDLVEALIQGRPVESAPAPRTEPDAKRHNLPAQLTSFIGRSLEVAECMHRLSLGRLLTLTGVGGSGKSRLMLRVAEELIDRYPGGVWFVDLSAISDPTRAGAALAAALGLRQVPGESLSQTVTTHLRARSTLVLFDNCEHMLAPMAEQIRTLLRECPHLHVLATSREALRIEGERSYTVPPLSLPDARLADPEAAGASEAVWLFVERARLVRPGFALDVQSTPIVVEICRRLDGIPLALELAAARMKILSATDIRTRLEDRFRLLTGGSRTALSRHQTLRETIQWSYDHLTAEEQGLLRGLSVFAGGWTLEAAAALDGKGRDEMEVLNLLTALAEKSLVLIDSTPAADSRYRFLETVRQYALEKLREGAEEKRWRDEHLNYMLDFVERAEPELIGPHQESWFKRLEAEHENILSAMGWCEHADSGAAKALRMGGSLWRFWWFGGHFALGLATLRTALDRDGAASATPERAQALYAAAQMAREMGDYGQARDLFHQSLEVATALGDPSRIARAYNGLGNTAEYAGDYASARSYHEMALALSRQLGNKRAVAIDLHNLGIVLMIQKEFDAARPLFEEGLDVFRGIGDVNSVQATVTHLATIAAQTKQFPAACRYFAESFQLAEELPSQPLTADSLESFAVMAVEMGAAELAARILGTAEAVREATAYALSVETKSVLEATRARIRSQLGEERQAALDAEGRGTTFEAAVQSVREWLAGALKQPADPL
ncbi:MAG TPA: protein kinase [Candidatus Eisenbacteria bacterium]|nr:protein kinase [Candidatus Eisenbacteria bacterium]